MKKFIALTVFTIFIVETTRLEAQERFEPEFPKENKSLLFVEAEDAVATNFAKEPTLNYGCSGSRSLQLSRSIGLHGNAPFYAEYVIFAREAGEYELWYGGSPAGPEDDLLPSFSSPLRIRIDEEKPLEIYRETINVVEGYTPTYYWNRLKKNVTLSQGTHLIRFEVKDKRRYDGKYFFYLDAFFLRRPHDAEKPEKPLVKFPTQIEYRGIDTPFSSIQEYENIIKAKPDAVDQYIYLSQVHSLLGDFQSALKTLKRAAALQPSGGQILLLLAKNRIWKGDSAEGLAAYRQYLTAFPTDLDIWKEAGKVAAWIGKYAESLAFYSDALSRFPDDAALLVNIGLTYLWKSEEEKADRYFAQAFEKSASSPELINILASIYAVNGYSDKAVMVYKKGLELFPKDLSLYLKLAGVLSGKGKTEEAEAVYRDIRTKFVSSPKLDEYLALVKEEQSLKTKVIEGFRKDLDANPDNLELREALVQTYFWNGMKEEALRQNLAILANHAFRAVREYDKENRDVFAYADRIAVYRNFFADATLRLAALRREAGDALNKYGDALKYEERLQAASAKGESLTAPAGGDPRDLLREEGRKLAETTAKVAEFLERVEANVSRFKDETSGLAAILEKQKTADESFSRLSGPLGWKWDKAFYRNELAETAKTERVMASYVLGRIAQVDRSSQEARRRLGDSAKDEKAPPAVRYGVWEIALWTANEEDKKTSRETYGRDIIGYAPFASAVGELEDAIRKETLKAALFTEETEGALKTSLPELDKVRNDMLAKYGEAEKIFTETSQVLRKKLEAKFFDLQEKTLLLRYDLGDYYLAGGQAPEATKQFRHVLEMEPSNLNALYKLGISRQRFGDWYEAMEYYKQVYRIDPRFENAEGYHNLLARSHPDQIGFEMKSFADTSRVVTTAEGFYAHAFNSDLGFEARAATENLSLYQDGYGDVASSHQLHTLSASLPMSFLGPNLTVTPKAGFSLASGVYDTPGGYTGSGIPSPFWYLAEYKIAPDVGLSAAYSGRSFNLSGGYSLARERDTFIPGRPTVYRHTGEGTFVMPWLFDNRYGLASISSRTYGKVSYLDDGNVKGMAVEDGTMLFHVKDDPWTTVGFSAILAFEHSLKPAKDDIYYSPNGVLLAKTGPLGSAWIPLKDGQVLGVILQILPGAYTEKILTSAKTSFYFESSLRLELVLDQSSFYFTAYQSGTIGPADDYWSVQFSLGYSHKIQSLLAQ